MNVGFIGLGNIGKPMALRLVASEHDLTVYDVAQAPLDELAAAGAQSAESVAELAAWAEVVCVMVRDDDQVRQVLDQARGTLGDAVVVIHSTVAPKTPAALADGIRLLDAPVSGGAMGASDGTLAIMVGGDETDFETVRPVLEAMGSKVVYAGPHGAGTKLKLARNLMHFVAFTAATEASRLAEAAGLDLVELGTIVRHTDAITGGPGAIMHRDTTAPLDESDFWHGVFTHVADLGEKDLRFAIELADGLGVPTPLADLALTHLRPGLGLGLTR